MLFQDDLMLFQDARESPYFQNRDRNFPAARRRLCFSSCSRTCLPATPGWRRIASSRSERLQAAKATRIWTDLGRAGERAGNCWMRRSTWKRSLSLGAWRWRTVHSVFRLRFSSKLALLRFSSKLSLILSSFSLSLHSIILLRWPLLVVCRA
jgi:hypothetical protein